MSDLYKHFRTDRELRAGVLMWQVFPPILIVFGTFGNVLTVVVFSKPKFNKSASTTFLLALAVADLAVLYIGLMRQWIKFAFDVDVRHLTGITCKVHWWLMFVSTDCSVWTLTAITTDRLISTLCPLKSKFMCSKKTAKIAVAFIIICAFFTDSHLLFGFDRLEIKNGNTTVIIPCGPVNDKYEFFFDNYWPWIDLCKFSLIPFVVLATGNAFIISRVVSSRRRVKRAVAPAETNSASPSTQKNNSLSTLLLTLNTVFIICTLPICVYFGGQPYWIPLDIPRQIQQKDPWWAFVNILLYLNNSVNFVLYCLTGSRFRSYVKSLFKFRVTPFQSTVAFIPTSNNT